MQEIAIFIFSEFSSSSRELIDGSTTSGDDNVNSQSCPMSAMFRFSRFEIIARSDSDAP